jgi:hypothetical protein
MRIPVRYCSCEDFPCCGHNDDFALTGQDAIDAMHEDEYDIAMRGPLFDDDLDDSGVWDDLDELDDLDNDEKVALSGCDLDMLHDMAFEDRIGGTGYDY